MMTLRQTVGSLAMLLVAWAVGADTLAFGQEAELQSGTGEKFIPWRDNVEGSPPSFFLAAVERRGDASRSTTSLPWALVDARTYEVADPNWCNQTDFHLVRGSDEWVIPGRGKPIDTLLGRRAQNRGVLDGPPTFERLFSPRVTRGEDSTIRVVSAPTSSRLWMNIDGRRLAWVQGGDVWRGVFDLESGDVVEAKQVTDVGLFEGKGLVLWAGQALYLWGGFDTDRPVVRINLADGEVREVDWFNFNQLRRGEQAPRRGPAPRRKSLEFATNPSRSLLVAQIGEAIRVLDLSTGESRDLSLTADAIPIGTNTKGLTSSGVPRGPVGVAELRWISDTKAYLCGRQWFLQLDLIKGEARIRWWASMLGKLAEPPSHIIQIGELPDRSTLLALTKFGPLDGRLFTLNFETRKAAMFPKLVDSVLAGGQGPFYWLDNDRLAYERRDGGIANVGLWVYDLRTQKSFQATNFVPRRRGVFIAATDTLLVNRETAGASGSSHMTYAVDLTTQERAKIGDNWSAIASLPSERLPLDYSAPAGALWEQGDRSTLPDIEAPVTGIHRVLAHLESETDELRDYAVSIYDFLAAGLDEAPYYDRERLTLSAVRKIVVDREGMTRDAERRRAAGYPEVTPGMSAKAVRALRARQARDAKILRGEFPEIHVANFVSGLDVSVAFERERAMEYCLVIAKDTLAGSMGSIPRERHSAVAAEVAEKVADQLAAESNFRHRMWVQERVTGAISGVMSGGSRR